MKKMKGQLVGIIYAGIFSLGLVSTADAALTQTDYLAGSDNLAVYDSTQDLNWLDLRVSIEWSSTSWSTSVEQNAGWRLATNSEVESMLISAFPNATDPHLINATNYSDPLIVGDINSFYTLFGDTAFATFDRSYGLYQDEDSIWRMAGVDNFGTNRTIWGGEFTNDYTSTATSGVDGFGMYIVQDASVVPVPAAIWLFGSGLIGLIGIARRKA